MKKSLALTLSLAAALAARADVGPMTITPISFSQDSASQDVTVRYNLSNNGDPAWVCMDVLTDGVSIGTSNLKTFTGDISIGTTNFIEEGNRTIVWKARTDWPRHVSTNATVRVYAYYTNHLGNVPDVYMVVDLSGGSTATSYPVSYTLVPPDPSNDVTCCSNKLWLKRIEAGTFTMGCPVTEPGHYSTTYNETARKVTIKKSFFAGVFPVTRAQYQFVVGGTAPGAGDLLAPVAQVSFDSIRGSTSAGINWPDTTNRVAASSFLGILRSRTGNVEFDLPTQAQWEYACRSGTTNGCWNDGSVISTESTENLKKLGWFDENSAIEGTNMVIHPVGQKKPNLWGLYDMHGNSWDECLDWWKNDVQIPATPSEGDRGYVGLPTGTTRAIKGGCYNIGWKDVRAARSWVLTPSSTSAATIGFRLFVTLP